MDTKRIISIVAVGLLMLASVLFSPEASAAPEFLDKFEVEKTFAVSDTNTQSLWISQSSYPKAVSNWPTSATTLSGMWPSYCGSSKALPFAVGYRGGIPADQLANNLIDNSYNDITLYFNGNIRNYPGNCEYVEIDIGEGDANFGTQQKAPWVNFMPGYTPSELHFRTNNNQLWPVPNATNRKAIREGHGVYIDPTAYGGWATSVSYPASSYGFYNAYNTQNNYQTCPNQDFGKSGSGRPQLTENIVGLGMRPRVIWGNPCNTSYIGYSYNTQGYRSTVYTNGTTLFRQVVNFTQKDIDDIRNAENYIANTTIQNNFGTSHNTEMKGGLYISMVADDFVNSWVNGAYATSVETTVATENYFRIPLSPENGDGSYGPFRIRVGSNLLAFEANDKFMSYSRAGSAGVGLAYALNLMLPLPGSTYKLQPTTGCRVGNSGPWLSAITNVAPGESIECLHTAPIANNNPTEPPRQYSESTKIDGTCSVEEGAGVPQNCSFSQSNVSILRTSPYTRIQSFNAPSVGKVCTQISATPSAVDKVMTRVVGSERRVSTRYQAIINDMINRQGYQIDTAQSNSDWTILYRTTATYVVNNNPVSSNQVCITVASAVDNHAHALFFRGDIIASGDVAFENNTDTKGSKAQLAIIAKGAASDAFSANSLTSSGRYNLVYGNADGIHGQFGRNVSAYTIPALPQGLVSNNSPIDLTLHPNTTQYYKTPNASSIRSINGASNINARHHVVVDGNVQIAGNIMINYTAPVSLGNIPNIIIEATGNIIIAPGVTQIDATLIAGGTLFTCGNTKPTTQGTCNNKLTINGPTKAKNYRFWRTNTDTSATSASEVFVFPPSAIMSPYGAASTGSKLSTDYELELPPRY